MSVSASRSTGGFNWIVDSKGCEDILGISSGFIINRRFDSDGNTQTVAQGALVDEVFTLIAIGEGLCTYTMAQARPGEAYADFNDYRRSGGLVIKIPIQVGKLSDRAGKLFIVMGV